MIQRWTRELYFWVWVGIIVGGGIGVVAPEVGTALKPLGDGFIALIKMIIGPLIFCTVVLGISSAGDMRKVSRVGLKSLFYFEVISTFALAIGLAVANGLRPGSGFNFNASQLTETAVSEYTRHVGEQSVSEIILHIIPKTFFDAFSGTGDLIQVLLIALLFGYSMNKLGKRGEAVHHAIEGASHIFFGIVKTILKLAPLGAGGAMAFTVGKYGVSSLLPLGYLVLCFYLTCILFVLIVLGGVAHLTGFSILKFIKYIQEELIMVLGTSSSESALVPLMDKLERLGCPKPVVGLVVPAGYSFNLDGTNIYLTLAGLFVAQAMGIELSLLDQLKILGVAMLTSKGASAVPGGGVCSLSGHFNCGAENPSSRACFDSRG